MRKLNANELVEVGDILVIDTALNVQKYKITRVTKTQCISKRPDDGYEHKFRRRVQFDRRLNAGTWNTSNFTVWRDDDEN